MSAAIRSKIYSHGPRSNRVDYELQIHELNAQKLCVGSLSGVDAYLKRVFDRCPPEPFENGPRASKTPLRVPCSMQKVRNHRRCLQAFEALEQNVTSSRDRHQVVQNHLIRTDPSIVAVEVPVWADKHQMSGVPISVPDGEYLSGHIDILSVEDDFLWIWDYKPTAVNEQTANCQILLYCWMLAEQAGIPWEKMRCGYFDAVTCYSFEPNPMMLKQAVTYTSESKLIADPKPARQKTSPNEEELDLNHIQSPHPEIMGTVKQTWYRFTQRGESIPFIAEARGIKQDTVYEHLSKLAYYGVVQVTDFVPQELVQQIEVAYAELGKPTETPLKRVYERLGGRVSYGQIKSVIR